MKILIGKGSCGISAGADQVTDALAAALKERGVNARLVEVGCIGMCYLEPIVDVIHDDPNQPTQGSRATFVKIDAAAALEIAKYAAGEPNGAAKYALAAEDRAVLKRQVRIALANCGNIDPNDIDQYIENRGYEALKSLAVRTPDEVIAEIKTSGLAGRGGAGFPTWFKWRAARDASCRGELRSPGPQKYVICNADEGDPGAFMDRAIIEGDPHALIEGMIICAYAIGASEGVVYVRAEYPLAVKRLEKAIDQAYSRGFLGTDAGGLNFHFDLKISRGAGAFVCGEETALIASLEGERGMPRLKPPFPAQKGLWQRPSNINNVETYANVPWIIRNGGAAFAAVGTETSKGTKVFALTGKVRRGGLAEIPMGSTIRDVIFEIGGGIPGGRFKAVQLGGPSGGCIPERLIDTPVDYKALAATGAIMGSGGMVVMDGTTCMVDMARFFMAFTCKESCGKCAHCRVGTKRMLEILEKIVDGRGEESDLDKLRHLAVQVKEGALCGLGQTAPNPVLTTLRYFENEYIDHVRHKRCTAHQCAAFMRYSINGNCTGCTACARKCPVSAITVEPRSARGRSGPARIDSSRCIKCGRCAAVCRFSAIERVEANPPIPSGG
ncbi:MAG: NADH-quinone oxidoreductase subunit NuoF [Clostridiales bacterium]|jgi:NADH-quinone oxidoreductase subunit F|nr:NADH-quinone oxidoreductase subunit NuoF [Clostridiales bacterium]